MDRDYRCAESRTFLFHCRLPGRVLVAALALAARNAAGAELEDLRNELTHLREENAQMKIRLESQARSIESLTQRMANLDGKPAPMAGEKPAAPAGEMKTDMAMGNAPDLSHPNLSLRWFGDVNYRAGGKTRAGSNVPNTFSLGQLDLMAHSQLSEKLSVMSEIVFQYRDTEVAATTIERLQFQYHASDLFNLRLGRTHTPFGYWNETFHHGTWFQTTVLRPDLLRFHDGGSVLPIHSVGVEVYGYKPLSLLDVHYTVGVANGRGLLFSDTVDAQDLNNHKAVYGVLSFAPAAVAGLRLGVNGYVDVIPPDTVGRTRLNPMDEEITGAHVSFVRDNVEFLAEAMRIVHKDPVAARKFTTWGMYAQAAYQMGEVKPYFRFDLLEAGTSSDPYYGTALADLKRYTAGVRWDMISWAALKLEYQYIRQRNLNSPHAVYSQATFSF